MQVAPPVERSPVERSSPKLGRGVAPPENFSFFGPKSTAAPTKDGRVRRSIAAQLRGRPNTSGPRRPRSLLLGLDGVERPRNSRIV